MYTIRYMPSIHSSWVIYCIKALTPTCTIPNRSECIYEWNEIFTIKYQEWIRLYSLTIKLLCTLIRFVMPIFVFPGWLRCTATTNVTSRMSRIMVYLSVALTQYTEYIHIFSHIHTHSIATKDKDLLQPLAKRSAHCPITVIRPFFAGQH